MIGEQDRKETSKQVSRGEADGTLDCVSRSETDRCGRVQAMFGRKSCQEEFYLGMMGDGNEG